MRLGKISTFCIMILFAAVAMAQTPPKPADNATRDAGMAAIVSNADVQKVVQDYVDESDARFDEFLELVRIASPSREEYYRAAELAKRLKAAGFTDDEIVFTGTSGIMDGAGIQLVDGRKVYQTCAIIKGTSDDVVDNLNIFSTPKVLIEGHIDTVNPANIPNFNPANPPSYEPIKIAPATENVVATAEELAAIIAELKFDANGKVIKDANYDLAKKRFDNLADARGNGGYRMYVPGYGDAMANTVNIYYLAKLFKRHNITPVHDIWFCFTAGEEGRGNLAGMKQLYGYNQQATPAEAPTLAEKGRNTLNFVANLSIDGGAMTINYLGSYRYEVNYSGYNAAKAAARAIALIADVKAPQEDIPPTGTVKATYTVGVSYKKADGTTSFEIDMRSADPAVVDIMKNRLYPNFQKGADLQSAEGEKVKMEVLWFGDRPAHARSADAIANDPLIYAAWNTYDDYIITPPLRDFVSTSLNDNIPGAMNIPSVNMSIAANAAGGGGHAFYEWGIRGQLINEQARMERILYTLLAVSGLDGVAPAAYPDKAPRHTNQKWDN